jgi:FkbM family methyltransferase
VPRTASEIARSVLSPDRFARLRNAWHELRATWEEPAPLFKVAANVRERASLMRLIAARIQGDDDNLRLRLAGMTYWMNPLAGEFYPLIELHRGQAYSKVTGFVPLSGWTVIDVGANIGVYAVFAASVGARVIAYEPNPQCYRRLTNTIRDSGLSDRITAQNYGVGQSSSIARLQVRTGLTVQGRVELVAEELGDGETGVQIRSLDELLIGGTERIDLLKIDTEGFEVEVLRGSRITLARVDRVILEYHSVELLTEAARMLRHSGFEIADTAVDDGRPGLGELYARRLTGNYVPASTSLTAKD